MSLTLTNYWWLLIWLFLGGAICSYFPKRRELLNDRIVTRWDVVPAIIMVLPYIVWAGFRGDFADTYLYRRYFLNATGGLPEAVKVFFGEGKDTGYYAMVVILRSILGNRDKLYFTLVAAAQLLSMVYVFRRYSEDFWMCIFLFIASTDYISWMFNGMRQFIAVSIILAGFPWMVKKKYVKMILLILLASLFHGSALLMIPIVFVVQGEAWNAKTILMLAATMVIVAFVDRFTPMLNDLLQDTQYDDMMTNEIWAVDDGTNIFRVLVYSAPALLSLFGLKYIRAAKDPVMNICVNCSIVTMALYAIASVTSGIYIGRLPIYTTLQGYIALPWMIGQIFEKKSAQLVKILVCAAFVCFFYFQMGITWNML